MSKRKAIHVRRYYRLRLELNSVHPDRDYFSLPDYVLFLGDELGVFDY